MNYFDKNNRNGIARTHDRSPSYVLAVRITKLKEKILNYNI